MVIRGKLSIIFFFPPPKASRTKVGKASEILPPPEVNTEHQHTLLRSFASTELRDTAERGKHTSRLKLLSSIIQKDWRLLSLGTVLCQALLQPPPLPESAKPALFPAELQFGWRAMPIHPRPQLCPTAPSEKSEESKLSSQRTEMLSSSHLETSGWICKWTEKVAVSTFNNITGLVKFTISDYYFTGKQRNLLVKRPLKTKDWRQCGVIYSCSGMHNSPKVLGLAGKSRLLPKLLVITKIRFTNKSCLVKIPLYELK